LKKAWLIFVYLSFAFLLYLRKSALRSLRVSAQAFRKGLNEIFAQAFFQKAWDYSFLSLRKLSYDKRL